MLWALLSTKIQVQRIECSDIRRPLIELWQIVRDDPNSLARRYEELRSSFVSGGGEIYYRVRDDFNRSGNPYLLFFLTRTCRLGHVRFNRKGMFTAPVHHGSFGAEPKRVASAIDAWHRKLVDRCVEFTCRDYRHVRSRPGDLLYLDPPYRIRQRIYGRIDFSQFFRWLSRQSGEYLLSLNGYCEDEDNTVAVPRSLFDRHLQLDAGTNHQQRLGHGVNQRVSDSLYIRQRRPLLTTEPDDERSQNKSEAIRRLLEQGDSGVEPKPKQIREILAIQGIVVDGNLIKVVRHHWRRGRRATAQSDPARVSTPLEPLSKNASKEISIRS